MCIAFFVTWYCDGSTVEKVVNVTAAACGVSNTIAYECKKEMKNVKDGHVSGLKDGRKKSKTPERNNCKQFPEWVESQIRNLIHRDFFMKNLTPTLHKIHAAIKSDPVLPNISLSALHKLLLRIGFVYKSRKRNSILMERPDITEWRHRYLRAIRKHRYVSACPQSECKQTGDFDFGLRFRF